MLCTISFMRNSRKKAPSGDSTNLRASRATLSELGPACCCGAPAIALPGVYLQHAEQVGLMTTRTASVSRTSALVHSDTGKMASVDRVSADAKLQRLQAS